MAKASRTITINKPASEVFEYLLTGENNKEWRPDVLTIKLKSGKPNTVGAEYLQQMKGPFGQKIQGDYKITELEKNKLIKFVVTAGPARPTGEYTFASEKNATKLTFTLSLEPKGFTKLLAPMIEKQMEKEMNNLDTLKEVLEEK